MKLLKSTLFISFAVFVQTTIYAQVIGWPNTTNPVVGDWPANTAYSYFGTNATSISQTAGGNYALIQGKSSGITFLNSPQYIGFRINNSQMMTLANNGYLGIGTASPAALLDVNGTAIFNGQSLTIGSPTGAANERFYLKYDGSVAFARINTTSYVGLSFGTNGTNDQMVITQAGKVGIGTASPMAMLDVNGTAIFNNQSLTIGSPTGAANERFYLEYDGSVAIARINTTSNVGLSFGTNGANDQMVITQAGNVGIGVKWQTMYNNSPGYKLAVNGTIGARAIVVETSSGEWSDYVFEKNYKLKTIPELEAFINTNKHLPNVPSACEVEEKGIDIATMDATLLAKIEELSLYIIEQNKKLEAQNKELKVQNTRIEALEKK